MLGFIVGLLATRLMVNNHEALYHRCGGYVRETGWVRVAAGPKPDRRNYGGRLAIVNGRLRVLDRNGNLLNRPKEK